MRKLLFFIVFVIIIFSTISQYAQAVGLLNFGTTKVISSFTPGVVCLGIGPATIAPNGIWPATPYYFSPASMATSLNVPKNGVQVLGKYTPVLSPLCLTDAGFPYLVFPVTKFGASKLPRF